MTTQERFLKKVYPEPNTGCWLWGGFFDKKGYGRVFYPRLKIASPHRLSYLLYKGEFDRSLLVCHSCDNPACVNPDHLFLGTNQDNIDDRNKKGRSAKGVNCASSKVTPEQVLEMRIIYDSGEMNTVQIGKKFGINSQQVGKIVNRKAWLWL
jgi:hypothetical protein